MAEQHGPVVVASVGSRVEAELIVGLFKSNGVRALIQADDAAGWEPQFQRTNGVRVLVGSADEAKARALLADVEKRSH